MNTAAATTIVTRMKVRECTAAALSTENAGRPERQREQQETERHRRRPRGPVDRRGEALDHAENHPAHHGAGKVAEPAEHADREHAPEVFAPDRRLNRLDDD